MAAVVIMLGYQWEEYLPRLGGLGAARLNNSVRRLFQTKGSLGSVCDGPNQTNLDNQRQECNGQR